MALDRNPLLHVFADKFAVRTYVEEKVGKQYLPQLLAVAENVEGIDWTSLPEEFVAKVSHGSGGVIVISRSIASGEGLPCDVEPVGWVRFACHPDQLVIESLTKLLSHWLTLPFAWWPGRLPEWAYEGNDRKILIEGLIDAEIGVLPTDIKVFVFNGKAQVIRVQDVDGNGLKRLSSYDSAWNLLPVKFIDFTLDFSVAETPLARPENLAEIIQVSEALGSDVDFVRVDLYNSSRGLLVGELTNYPTAGEGSHDPPSFDEWLGKDWAPSYSSQA
jgi:hypothetical protein